MARIVSCFSDLELHTLAWPSTPRSPCPLQCLPTWSWRGTGPPANVVPATSAREPIGFMEDLFRHRHWSMFRPVDQQEALQMDDTRCCLHKLPLKSKTRVRNKPATNQATQHGQWIHLRKSKGHQKETTNTSNVFPQQKASHLQVTKSTCEDVKGQAVCIYIYIGVCIEKQVSCQRPFEVTRLVLHLHHVLGGEHDNLKPWNTYIYWHTPTVKSRFWPRPVMNTRTQPVESSLHLPTVKHLTQANQGIKDLGRQPRPYCDGERSTPNYLEISR